MRYCRRAHGDQPLPEVTNATNEIATPANNTLLSNLPSFTPVSKIPRCEVNKHTGEEFVFLIDNAYEQIIKWRKNLFKLPSGNASKRFINELSTWLENYNNNTELQYIALKVFHVIPALLLQKPSKNSKAKDHLKKLEERIAKWKEGEITSLLQEAKLIQDRLTSSRKPRSADDVAKIFARMILQGKTNAALKFISSESSPGVHQPTEAVFKELQNKHPPPAPIRDNSLLYGPVNKVPANYFDNIDEQSIFKAAQLTKGAGGPSHVDAEQYRFIITSNRFKNENKYLREQIAIFAQKLGSELLDPSTLEAFIGCRLIPLDKNPGIRPIGIGEVLRRIIGKVVGWVLKSDLMEATGPLQAACGLQGGAEAAIHSMRTIFESDDTEAVILVDATNAFNTLNRQVALHNVRITCPPFATILINTYRQGSRLSVANCDEITSLEGTTQGDNLGGHFYNQGTIPLQNILQLISPQIKQVWLADDATGGGSLPNLLTWWNTIITEGPKFGYIVNEPKSWLIIKDSNNVNYAKDLFKDSNIKFTTDGKRHLGAAIGSDDFRVQYCTEKISKWCDEMTRLTESSKTQPQAAYAAYIHGEQHKFNYFLRTLPGMEELLEPLDRIINEKFLPALLGKETLPPWERGLYALPIRMGGLGIPILQEKAPDEFSTSLRVTAPLATIMAMQGSNLPQKEEVDNIRADMRRDKNNREKEKAAMIEETLPDNTKRAVKQAQEKGASNWLSTLPLSDHGFTLNKGEFRDAVAIRYSHNLRSLPSKCPCGQKYSLDHALNCKRGGFVIMRHNNVRDFEASLLQQVCKDVETEPPLQPLEGENIKGLQNDGARPDIRARGFWRPGQNAYFDVRLTNVNSSSQSHLTSERVFTKYEAEKRREYNQRIMNVEHGTFTPLVFALNGGMGPECKKFHQHLAKKIADKSGESYSNVITIIRCKLSFLILRACLMCVRGSRPHVIHNTAFTGDDFHSACREARLIQ